MAIQYILFNIDERLQKAEEELLAIEKQHFDFQLEMVRNGSLTEEQQAMFDDLEARWGRTKAGWDALKAEKAAQQG